MKTTAKTWLSAVICAALLAGCAGMTPRERSTATGAVVGGLAGNVISGGSTAGTVAGAVAGGAIGYDMETRRYYRRYPWR